MQTKTLIEAGERNSHTFGPWKFETLGDTLRVTTSTHEGDNDDICVVGDCRNSTNQANARLIASAPELLEALKKLLPKGWTDKDWKACDRWIYSDLSAAREAIAKAEGTNI